MSGAIDRTYMQVYNQCHVFLCQFWIENRFIKSPSIRDQFAFFYNRVDVVEIPFIKIKLIWGKPVGRKFTSMNINSISYIF